MTTTTTQSNPPVETFRLGSLTVPRLFVGLWQLSGSEWGGGVTSVAKMRNDMLRHLNAGCSAFGQHLPF